MLGRTRRREDLPTTERDLRTWRVGKPRICLDGALVFNFSRSRAAVFFSHPRKMHLFPLTLVFEDIFHRHRVPKPL